MQRRREDLVGLSTVVITAHRLGERGGPAVLNHLLMADTAPSLRSEHEAEQAGGKIVRPAAWAELGGMTGAFAHPDGYVWEVAHNNPGWTMTDDGSIRL
jgi:uncharacterized protein